ncbi:MAG: tetratricopeptide repeat protein [Bacteroidetes bacterium]|nr:tetratricopeptide repeat protein [Bacteroidota bacterium]
MLNRILFLFFFFAAFPVYSVNVDSLLARLETTRGTDKVELLLSISEAYINTSGDNALVYAEEAFDLASSLKDKMLEARALENIGNAHNILNNHEMAIRNYEQALEIFQDLNSQAKTAVALSSLAIVYYKISEYYYALEYGRQALNLNLQLQDSLKISESYNTLGLIYWKLGDLGKALSNYMESMNYSDEDNHNTINNIGIIYGVQGNYEKALEHQLKALEIRQRIGNKIGIAGSLNNIGIIYNRLNKLDTALIYFLEALKIRLEIGQSWRLAGAYNNVGSIYQAMGEYQTALDYYRKSLKSSNEAENAYEFANTLLNMGNVFLEIKQYDSAQIYLQDGVLLSDRIQAKTLLRNGYFALYEMFQNGKDFSKALDYFKAYSVVKDSLISEQSQNKLAELRIKYETEDKERENELLRKNNSIQNLKLSRERNIRYLFSVILILTIILIILFFNRYKTRKNTAKMLTEKNIQINKINQDLRRLNNELEERVKERTKNLEDEIFERKQAENVQRVLYRIARAASTALSLKDLIQVVKTEVSKILELKNFFIALYDRESDSLSLPYFVDEKDQFEKFPDGKTLTSMVIHKKQMVLLKHDDILQMINSGEITQNGTLCKVWLGIPLHSEGEIIGAFVVQNYENENAFNKNDIKVLEFIADQIGIIIERKSSEDKLRRAKERAEESDRLKTAFLTNMSHEIRTPMNAIIGFSNLLLKPDLPQERKSEYIEVIRNNTTSLLKIIDDIIDTARLEVGEIKIEEENFHVNKVIDELVISYVQELKKLKKDVEIITKKHIEDQSLTMRTDPYRVRQILSNLLSNAIKFVEKGFIEVGYVIRDKKIEFYVKDSGIGIPADKQNVIFDRFRQAEETYTRKYGGTGLGLSISRTLVNMLGGEIWLDSAVGKGTTFYFNLPFHPVENITIDEKPQLLKKRTRQDLKNFTILVAEDVASNFELVKELLEITAAKVLWVKNGSEAVEKCKANEKISLVLMDISMPEMDGLTATRLIKEFRPSLPVIAVTAFARQEEKEKFLNDGCDDYIPKPIDEKQLLDSIYHLLHKE